MNLPRAATDGASLIEPMGGRIGAFLRNPSKCPKCNCEMDLCDMVVMPRDVTAEARCVDCGWRVQVMYRLIDAE